jgi:uncharacterized protein with ATP-grasp and redox domains
MMDIPRFGSVDNIRYGLSPTLDAWLAHFMTENRIEHLMDPGLNASPEQLRFMVALDKEGVYIPCSDGTLSLLLAPEMSRALLNQYLHRWRLMVELVRLQAPDRYLFRRILNLCRHKFRLYMHSHVLIPSRLMKRLNTIIMTQSGLDDLCRDRKRLLNRRARDLIQDGAFQAAINARPGRVIESMSIPDARFELSWLELSRLLVLSTLPDAWRTDEAVNASADKVVLNGLDRETSAQAEVMAPLRKRLAEAPAGGLTILILPSRSGGLLFDLLAAKALIRMGHRVVVALKAGFYFYSPAIWDMEDDPLIAAALADARVLSSPSATKNELLKDLKENPFLVISDGTRERLNLHRTSVSFARAWKEADIVIAKGEPNANRLVRTSYSFTRDVVCLYRDASGAFRLHFRPKPEWVRKFSEKDLTAKALDIIQDMRGAKAQRRKVMFYSAIIGSVPGQVDTAIKVVNTFVKYLRSRMEDVYIINPAEHFEKGMDADDLMYMWERVQRSGLIDVWRFQSVEDIEKSFELMLKKVPPAWAGKDATYSTGCTKEMNTALDMQRRQPELQIIGPDPERFFRRREYGVGKYCDVAFEECSN